MINYMSNGKAMIVHLGVELIKKILLYKSYFPEPYTRSKNKIKLNQICLIMRFNAIQTKDAVALV